MFGVGCGRTGWSEKCPPLSDYGFDEFMEENKLEKSRFLLQSDFHCAAGGRLLYLVSGDRGDLASFPESGVDIYGGKTMGIFI